mmetsp:Transcript_31618/g.66246  ORF Transcript_31618/g.66246 Transcript_31618/m.66246 type:complete len:94 (+) Transcript_31618:241-522(+)
MLNVCGSEDVRLLVPGGGGEEEEEPLLVLRLQGGVKGVKDLWELDARRCSAELDVTGDWNGVWGGTRLGSSPLPPPTGGASLLMLCWDNISRQ